MPSFDATNAECLVFTYKEGLLSAIAHDLKIKLTRFQININEQNAIDARFFADSLRVVNPMQSGAENPSALSDSDKRKIEQTITDDVLRPGRFPEVRFVSSSVKPTDGSVQIEGQLTLYEKTRPISFTARKDANRYTAEIKIHQPDFGIKPYSAMLGTLKIKPDVVVKVSLPVW